MRLESHKPRSGVNRGLKSETQFIVQATGPGPFGWNNHCQCVTLTALLICESPALHTHVQVRPVLHHLAVPLHCSSDLWKIYYKGNHPILPFVMPTTSLISVFWFPMMLRARETEYLPPASHRSFRLHGYGTENDIFGPYVLLFGYVKAASVATPNLPISALIPTGPRVTPLQDTRLYRRANAPLHGSCA